MKDRDDANPAGNPADEGLEGLDRRLRRLPGEVPPARDLWPGIAARIRDAEVSRTRPAAWKAWAPVAAAASVALVAVLAVSQVRDRDPGSTPIEVVEITPAAASFGSGIDLGTGYREARAGLVDDLERSLDTLSPEAREIVLENLATIRRAVAEIDAALANDPSNGLLQNQLLAAYQDELTVLANMQRATARLPLRNEI